MGQPWIQVPERSTRALPGSLGFIGQAATLNHAVRLKGEDDEVQLKEIRCANLPMLISIDGPSLREGVTRALRFAQSGKPPPTSQPFASGNSCDGRIGWRTAPACLRESSDNREEQYEHATVVELAFVRLHPEDIQAWDILALAGWQRLKSHQTNFHV